MRLGLCFHVNHDYPSVKRKSKLYLNSKFSSKQSQNIFAKLTMSSNDLLTYSIMNVTYHRPPPCDYIKLPPILNYKLTENNLLNHQNFQDNKPTQFDNYYYKDTPSKASSVTSMSSADLPLTPRSPSKSPSFGNTSLSKVSMKEYASLRITEDQLDDKKKRRQRSGPSCDSCRARKVKCNAEIIILSNSSQTFNYSDYPAETHTKLNQGGTVKIDDFLLVISNDKLIKFKSCKSCNNKHLECNFSKGFTKEDILINRKITTKVEKKVGDRKSSCLSCRRRKIRCAMIGNKCENCMKKGSICQVIN